MVMPNNNKKRNIASTLHLSTLAMVVVVVVVVPLVCLLDPLHRSPTSLGTYAYVSLGRIRVE